MEICNWRVAIIAANRFEANILDDVLRQARVAQTQIIRDNSDLRSLSKFNIIISAIDAGPIDSLDWLRQLRRAHECRAQKAPVFMLTHVLSVALAERCRHAGANAIIGLPASAAIYLKTIQKVLAKPRPFVEAAGYAGPCRRAGIVQAGTGARRTGDAAAA